MFVCFELVTARHSNFLLFTDVGHVILSQFTALVSTDVFIWGQIVNYKVNNPSVLTPARSSCSSREELQRFSAIRASDSETASSVWVSLESSQCPTQDWFHRQEYSLMRNNEFLSFLGSWSGKTEKGEILWKSFFNTGTDEPSSSLWSRGGKSAFVV